MGTATQVVTAVIEQTQTQTQTVTSAAPTDASKAALQRALTRRRVITLSAEGEIGEREWIQIGEELFRMSHRGNYCVVLDFTEVSHLDYRGVRPLLSRAQIFRELGGDIKLCGLSHYLRAIFRAAGARDAFEYFDGAEEARTAFLHSAIG